MRSRAPKHRSDGSENLTELIVQFARNVTQRGFLSGDQFLRQFAALFRESRELREYAEGAWESEELRRRALTEANAKLANIAARFDVLLKEASDSGRAVANAERMRVEVKDIQQAVFRRSVGD